MAVVLSRIITKIKKWSNLIKEHKNWNRFVTSDLAFYVRKVAAGKKLLLFLFYVLTLPVTTYAYGKSIQQTVTNKQQPLGWSSASLPIILQASRNALEKREWKIEYMWPTKVANINALIDNTGIVSLYRTPFFTRRDSHQDHKSLFDNLVASFAFPSTFSNSLLNVVHAIRQ